MHSNVSGFQTFDLTVKNKLSQLVSQGKNHLADPLVTFHHFLVPSLGICIYQTDVDCSYDGPNCGMRMLTKKLQLSFVSDIFHPVVTK